MRTSKTADVLPSSRRRESDQVGELQGKIRESCAVGEV